MVSIRIAQAQINPTVGDFQGNINKIGIFINRAKEAGAEIVTFPELAITGYPPEDLLMKPSFVRRNKEAIKEVAEFCADICAVVGFVDVEGAFLYNSAALIHDKKIVGVYHKIELPNYGVFDEKRYFKSGNEGFVFDYRGVKISLTICEDIWVEKSDVEKNVISGGCSVVLNLSASPFHAGKVGERTKVVCEFAKRTCAYLFYNNMVGGQDELVFDGGSMVVTPQGEILARAERFREDMLVTDVEFQALVDKRVDEIATIKHYVIPSCEKKEKKKELVKNRLSPQLDEVEEIYQALILGTRDYLHKNRFEKAVLGLSGGIDSSLTACIASSALGIGNVIGVTMPSRYTSDETRADAKKLATNLGIKLIEIPLENIFQAYAESLQEAFGEGEPGVEMENLQARIRGNILMALSNRFGWLVLTTGNKSETATGYCTLYGDMAGGFAVIKDVPKTMVYKLAKLINKKAGRDIIPESVIARPPTAELRPNQKDEDTLPPYHILDPIIHLYVEEEKSASEIASEGFDLAIVDHVIRMVDRAEFKRRQAPPGVKITPKAFGKDRRMPITNKFRG
jgi:NAD+ synthase (glutamine-hydrolysing)